MTAPLARRGRNLLVGQIAGRVLAPHIAGGRLGPDAHVPVAELQEPTSPAPARQEADAIFQPRRQRVPPVLPDVTEGPPGHIPHGVVLPELVWVDLAHVVDTADADARAVAAVAPQQHPDLSRPVRQMGRGPQQQEGSVGVVVDRHSVQVECDGRQVAGHEGTYDFVRGSQENFQVHKFRDPGVVQLFDVLFSRQPVVATIPISNMEIVPQLTALTFGTSEEPRVTRDSVGDERLTVGEQEEAGPGEGGDDLPSPDAPSDSVWDDIVMPLSVGVGVIFLGVVIVATMVGGRGRRA